MPKKRQKRGTAEKTFTDIEKLIAAEGIKKSEAFERLAKRTGRSPKALAVTYYRVARQKREAGGVEAAPEQPKKRGRPPRVTPAVLGGSAPNRADAILKELAALIEAQQAEIARQQQEIAELRKMAAQFEKIRQVLGES